MEEPNASGIQTTVGLGYSFTKKRKKSQASRLH
jgi:hypothetical protein